MITRKTRTAIGAATVPSLKRMQVELARRIVDALALELVIAAALRRRTSAAPRARR